MSSSYTASTSNTFTVVHARDMSAKVATDLKRMQRLYGLPSDTDIAAYEAEVIELLRRGYLGTAYYGFRRDGEWIEPTLRYTAHELVSGANNDDPGRVPPGQNIVGASFYSYLTYSSAWDRLNSAEQTQVKQALPVKRVGADLPAVHNGYFADDKTYSAGGRSLARASVRSYA